MINNRRKVGLTNTPTASGFKSATSRLATKCLLFCYVAASLPAIAQDDSIDQFNQQRASAFELTQRSKNPQEYLHALKQLAVADRTLLGVDGLPAEGRAVVRDELANVLSAIANQYEQMKQLSDAERILAERLALQKSRFGAKAWQTKDAQLALTGIRQKKGLAESQRALLESTVVLQQQVSTLLDSGNVRAAIQKAQESANKLEQVLGKRHIDYAAILDQLADLHDSIGDWERAGALYEEVASIRRETQGAEHPEYATALNDLAFFHTSRGHYELAIRLFSESADIRGRVLGKKHPHYATSLNNLGHLYGIAGEYDRAAEMLLEASGVVRETLGEHHPHYGASLNNLATLYESIGEFGKAEPLFLRSHAIVRKTQPGGHPNLIASLNNLGAFYCRTGDYSRAETLLTEAKVACERSLGRNHIQYINNLENFAYLYRLMGDHAPAASLLIESQELTESVLGSRHPRYNATLFMLAQLLHIMEDNESSLQLAKEAISRTEQLFGKEHPDYARNLNLLAEIYLSVGDYQAAERSGLEAMRIRERRLGKAHPDYSKSLDTMAQVLQNLGKSKEAESTLKESKDICLETFGIEHPAYLITLVNLGAFYLAEGRLDEADPLFIEALQIGEEQFLRTYRSKSESAALQYLQSEFIGESPILSVRRQSTTADAETTYAFVWHCRSLIERIQRERRFVQNSSQEVAQYLKSLRHISQQLSALVLTSNKLKNRADRQRRLRKLTEDQDAIERMLAEKSEVFRRGQHYNRMMPADLATRLQNDVAVVQLIETSIWFRPPSESVLIAQKRKKLERTREYDAFVLRRIADGYDVEWIPLGSATDINTAIQDWLALIEQERGEATSDRHPAAVLREKLWEPLEEHLESIKHVVVIPDSSTSFIPWAALPGRELGTFLLEDYTLSTALSGQELYRQLTEPASEKGKLLMLGGVDYQTRGEITASTVIGDSELRLLAHRSAAMDMEDRIQWRALPGTASETETIAAMWRGDGSIEKLSGATANEDALQSAMPGAKYIHLATHGFFADPKFRSALQHDPKSEQLFQMPGFDLATAGRATVTGRNPLILSGIVLAGANLPPEKDELGLPSGADGIMTAQEVVYTDLRGTELVTLSACDTGKGTQVAGGEGIYGLQRAFHLAGARHVVASLWKVDDQATAALMKLFYHNLWIKKQPVAEALRNAQLTMLRNPDQIETLATSRGPNFNKTVQVTEAAEAKSDGSNSTRTPIRLWAAFTHSGPPTGSTKR